MPPVTFLQLPREIRDRIYDFVFPWKEIRPVFVGENPQYACSSDNPPRTPPLLLVNRQVSAEAALSYYGNRVWAGQSTELLRFLEKIGNCRNLIKVVKVDYASMESCEAYLPQLFGLLSCLSGLRLVELIKMVPNLEAAQKPPAVIALGALKDHVEVAIYNYYFHVDVSSDDAREITVRDSIWRRVVGAKIWVQDRKEVEDIPGWY